MNKFAVVTETYFASEKYLISLKQTPKYEKDRTITESNIIKRIKLRKLRMSIFVPRRFPLMFCEGHTC